MRWDFSSAIICPYFFISTWNQSWKMLLNHKIGLVSSYLEFLLNLHNLLQDGSIWWLLLAKSLVQLVNFPLLRSNEMFAPSSVTNCYLKLGCSPLPRHPLTRSWCCLPELISWNNHWTLETLDMCLRSVSASSASLPSVISAIPPHSRKCPLRKICETPEV